MITRLFCGTTVVFVLGGLICGLGFGFFSEGKQTIAVEINARESGTEIAKKEIALANEALKHIAELQKQDQGSAGLQSIPVWSHRLVEATRKSGATKPEIIEAVKQHLARMDQRVVQAKRLYEAALGPRLDVLNAQFEAMEAKALLDEELAK